MKQLSTMERAALLEALYEEDDQATLEHLMAAAWDLEELQRAARERLGGE